MTPPTPGTASPTGSTHPRRRWYQFGLASLLVAMTVAAAAVGYWRRLVSVSERQAPAAETLTKLGATVTWESELPPWLQWLPLADRCRRVVWVNLTDVDFKPDSLGPLTQLPDLQRLYLARSSVRDEDLPTVGRLTKLRRLALWRTKVTTAGLAHLTGLHELQVLDLHGNPFVDEGSPCQT